MARSRRLNKKQVLETAALIAERQGGVDKLTLTALAAALDVRPPSLYNHIDGLDGLREDLSLMAGQMLLADIRRATFGLSGAEALRAMGHAYRAFAHAHPALYPLTTEAPEAEQTERAALAQEWLQQLLLTMASLGLRDEEALHAIRAFRAVLHGFVSLEAGGGFKMDLDRDESYSRLLDMFVAGIGHTDL